MTRIKNEKSYELIDYKLGNLILKYLLYIQYFCVYMCAKTTKKHFNYFKSFKTTFYL